MSIILHHAHISLLLCFPRFIFFYAEFYIFSFCLLDLHCCKLAVDARCETACQDSLRRQFDSDVEAVESLEGGGCGPPSLDVSVTRSSQYSA